MTTAEKLLAGAMQAKTIREIPGLAVAMAAHEREVEEVRRRPWLPAEIRRVIAEKEAALRTTAAGLVDAARTRALKGFDQEEGQLRAQARASGVEATEAQVRSQVFRQTRAQQLAALADLASTPAAARAIHAEAKLTDDPATIRLVGGAVRLRLSALAAVDKGAFSPLRDAALKFEMEHQEWERKNPSTVERLNQIEHARVIEGMLHDQSAEFALRAYGLTDAPPAPAVRDAVLTGPVMMKHSPVTMKK